MEKKVEVSWLHNLAENTTDIRINRDKEDEKIVYSGSLMATWLDSGAKKPTKCLEVQEMTFEEAKERFY